MQSATYNTQKRQIRRKYLLMAGILLIFAFTMSRIPGKGHETPRAGIAPKTGLVKTVVSISKLYSDSFLNAGRQIVAIFTYGSVKRDV